MVRILHCVTLWCKYSLESLLAFTTFQISSVDIDAGNRQTLMLYPQIFAIGTKKYLFT